MTFSDETVEAVQNAIWETHGQIDRDECPPLAKAVLAAVERSHEWKAQAERIKQLEHDAWAYNGALGYPVPGDHDGKLTSGETPQCGMCNARQVGVSEDEAVEIIRKAILGKVSCQNPESYKGQAICIYRALLAAGVISKPVQVGVSEDARPWDIDVFCNENGCDITDSPLYMALCAIGIYPEKTKGFGEADYEKRTEYMNGWNAAVMTITRNQQAIERSLLKAGVISAPTPPVTKEG